MNPDSTLQICDLRVTVPGASARVPAVDGVSLSVGRGRTLGLVGESGCGKSLTALGVMRLVRAPVKVESGDVTIDGVSLEGMTPSQIRHVRGRRIGMLFQEPGAALNPTYTCGWLIAETLREHMDVTRREARAAAIDALVQVHLPDPDAIAKRYPHQLSGGQQQRAMLALALATGPSYLLADEPTTALDVTLQAQMLDLLREKRDVMGLGMLLISHDLGVVAQVADEVAVMYAGLIVERGDVASVFSSPEHPYTQGLLRAVPSLSGPAQTRSMAGSVPAPGEITVGCRFAPRCPLADKRCRTEEPVLQIGERHTAACWYPGQNIWKEASGRE